MTKLKQLYHSYFFKNSSPPFYKTKMIQAGVFLSLTLGACHTPKQSAEQQPTPPFTLIDASSQNWTAGRQEGGRGTDYYFKITLTTNDDVRFDTMWVNNSALPIFIARETHTVSNKPITYAKGDTIILRGTSSGTPVPGQPPVLSTGDALVRYSINAKPGYFTIQHIEKKQPLSLPTRN